MPRQQVYGKRSRAAYDTFAAFADSPIKEQVDVESLIGAVSTLNLDYGATGNSTKAAARPKRERKALGERNANSVVPRTTIPAQTDDKTHKRRKPQRVIEDSNDDKEQHIPSLDSLAQNLERLTFQNDRPAEALKASASVLDPIKQNKEPKSRTRSLKQQSSPDPLELANEPQVEPCKQPEEAETDVYSQHCASILSLAEHSLSTFNEWADQLSDHFSISKIAEASFGEVYRLSLVHDIDNISPADESVFKVIPLRAPEALLPKDKRKRNAALRKAEGMSRPNDVANEVKLLQRMSCIPGFTNFRDVRVLRGRPAPAFASAFHAWNAGQKAKKKDLSHFPDPSKKASYAEDQLWAVIEMQNAGTDLERFVESGACDDVWSVWDVFWQVVLSIAKGEEGAEFEHRDLHLGNVCVRRRPSDGTSSSRRDDDQDIDITINLNFTTLETTIIDYTLSRAVMLDGTTAFYDLAPASEAAVFEGDSTEEYQYDIYRYMRSALFLDDPLAEYPDDPADIPNQVHNDKTWESHDPITNLVWLHFLLYKLLEQASAPSSEPAPPKTKKFAAARRQWKRANELEQCLLYVQELLDPEIGLCKNEIRSASDIVALAVMEGWLAIEDVVGGESIVDEVGVEDEEIAETVVGFSEIDQQLDGLQLSANETSKSSSRTAGKVKTRQKKR